MADASGAPSELFLVVSSRATLFPGTIGIHTYKNSRIKNVN